MPTTTASTVKRTAVEVGQVVVSAPRHEDGAAEFPSRCLVRFVVASVDGQSRSVVLAHGVHDLGVAAGGAVVAEHLVRAVVGLAPVPGVRIAVDAPRPPMPSWLRTALRTHRVVLVDQRGTGRSTPVSASTASGRPDVELAAYLGHFRADSIVADAEVVCRRLTRGRPWTILGQSYGGFVSLTCLSYAPDGLAGCLVTGRLPALTADAAEIYSRLYSVSPPRTPPTTGVTRRTWKGAVAWWNT